MVRRNYLVVKVDVIEVEGKVIEILLNVMFKVELENGVEILVYVFGKIWMYYIKILFGDWVWVEMFLYDLIKGWIIFCFK